MGSFLSAINNFDKEFESKNKLLSFLSIDTQINVEVSIKDNKGAPNEEYYKWQFFYGLIYSGLYKNINMGAEVFFPKGNIASNPIKLDGAIFDDLNWFEWYIKWRNDKSQDALDWLRKHLVAVIEFKRENSKRTEIVFNQQLKPEIKESEADFCLGYLYDSGRLYIFQKKNGKIIRLDESYNQKGDDSSTKELSLHLTDAYFNIPSFQELLDRVNKPSTLDRSKRSIDELDLISGVHSKQINDSMSQILRVIDKFSMGQKGYEILIQILALKIFDEKRNVNNNNRKLDFYINDDENNFKDLNDEKIESFVTRFTNLFNEAKLTYHSILKKGEVIDFTNEAHIRTIICAIQQFQDYSFVRSYKTDLYQIIFYRFANEFAKGEKGQFITPLPLIDFLVQIVNPRNDQSVIDPTAGIGDFLSLSFVNSSPKLDDNKIFGVDNDEQMIRLAELNMVLNGDGNAKLFFIPEKGSVVNKIDGNLRPIQLIPSLHKYGNWDNWRDHTTLNKFDVVLTNPPFGENRKWEPKTTHEKEMAELYELWRIGRSGGWIDYGLVFLENAYRILKENGRLGIVLSNSIAAIPRWEKAREWLIDHMRIVAIFDLPANVFADTGANTTLLVAYKPFQKDLDFLNQRGYRVFTKNIEKVGYEVKTNKG